MSIIKESVFDVDLTHSNLELLTILAREHNYYNCNQIRVHSQGKHLPAPMISCMLYNYTCGTVHDSFRQNLLS